MGFTSQVFHIMVVLLPRAYRFQRFLVRHTLNRMLYHLGEACTGLSGQYHKVLRLAVEALVLVAEVPEVPLEVTFPITRLHSHMVQSMQASRSQILKILPHSLLLADLYCSKV